MFVPRISAKTFAIDGSSGDTTAVDLYLETSYIWTVTLFKSDLHFQIRFWINLYLAAAKFSSDVPSMLMLK